MNKCLFAIIQMILVTFLLAACGDVTVERNSTESVNDGHTIPEQFAPNPNILYSDNHYTINNSILFQDTVQNLTEGSAGNTYHGAHFSYEIIGDPQRLESLFQQLEKKLDEANVGVSPQITLWGNSRYTASFPRALSDGRSLDAALLENYDLLMIDLMNVDTVSVHLRPDQLVVENGIISLELQYGYTAASTSQSSGSILFIVIPKGCETAAVDLVFVEEWSKTSAGPGL